MKKLALVGFVLLAGCRRDPQPVTVVSPATRPDLKVNAFLLSNNALLGCNAWLDTTYQSGLKLAEAGQSEEDRPLSHDEPPIEGFDGSFNLRVPAQALLGTGPSTVKICGIPAGSAQHHNWELRWKIWDKTGGEVVIPQNSRPLSLPLNLTVEFEGLSGNPSPPEVVISRLTDNHGDVWEINASKGGPFADKSATLKVLAPSGGGKFRMKRIVLSNDTANPVLLTPAVREDTCAAFKICHDGEDCELMTTPAPCSGTVPNPGQGGGSASPQ
ncbi:MAG: hypothetical protein SFV51_08515 [Bryobacteraceae bacterium]|nr:hypothetical protein [Bryobacteraceae bacterium]